ncbi:MULTISPECIES: ATP-binding protein [unclassified Lentimonas]|uniref:ATP-binding protein n=1 Tax=unclassified Lentimonas TaxID=2630993 RepID=UPI001321936B|nr:MULTISPECIES: ATP-binding protein [unclassified Lentimonas]CAA6690440.1 ATP-dependent DNA helicase [Lentimonas sp. CC19]CAA6693837.1 ATP-dependent DNA helicase [Lentimonas sp. CC10]CAA7068644.1 ATP-dependent DNA helicase [Lentimonas sp. CC11]
MSFSNYNSALTLEGLQTKPEGQYLERKGRDTKSSKIANELIGMLNAGGGTLVYGMHDSGAVEDLNVLSPRELDEYRKLVHDFIHPPANIELEELLLTDGTLIFLFHVDHDYERLFQRKDNEAVYLRVADSNKGPEKRAEVKKLEYNKAIRSYEDEVHEDFDPADFDNTVCEAYRKAMHYQGTFEALAIKRNLATKRNGQLLFKNAAILLFAIDPSQYIANAYVRYVRYTGTERQSGQRFNVVKDERFEDCIPNLIRKLEAFMEASLRDYYYLNMENGRFERVPESPKDAWMEGIVNALCHRSYNLQGNSIYIKHFDDRLEISNSGPLPAQVTIENIGRERYARNPRITRVLADMGYVRELNEGVPRIFDAMRDSMLAEPVYTDIESTVTLTLRNKVTAHKETIFSETLERIEANWEALNNSQQRIIQILFEKQEMDVPAFEDVMPLTGQAIRYNLRHLIELKMVERLSEKRRDPNALYRFLNK